ncbi:DUF659 domain-containing protein [Cucumis melo var. makuwa]|uniref:DUF659 domain-containing protein n=1 Tax=Cucumis melo var. makuwa TaxID=1194695 RepID=A0A5D3CQ51_CUCMM|nr:DUF659 domain-containing protein [Cucumis melo var. makuwa]TYK13921.1 DUF659 domain-containing protein [Cucumis melo var. makuwa]
MFYVEDPSDGRWSVLVMPQEKDFVDNSYNDELGDTSLHCPKILKCPAGMTREDEEIPYTRVNCKGTWTVRNKGRERRKNNKYNHRMSQKGYANLVEEMDNLLVSKRATHSMDNVTCDILSQAIGGNDPPERIRRKYQLSSILKAHSLFGFLDDSLPNLQKHLPLPTAEATPEINLKHLQWLSCDQALVTLINATLLSFALVHIIGSVSSNDLWLSLEKRYSSNTRSNILQSLQIMFVLYWLFADWASDTSYRHSTSEFIVFLAHNLMFHAHTKHIEIDYHFVQEKVFRQLDLPLERHISLCEEKGDIETVKQPWKILPSGHKIGTPEQLCGKKQQAKNLHRWQTKSCCGTRNYNYKTERVGLITKAQKHPDADSLYVKKLMWEIATSNCWFFKTKSKKFSIVGTGRYLSGYSVCEEARILHIRASIDVAHLGDMNSSGHVGDTFEYSVLFSRLLIPIKGEWHKNGVSIVSDGWSDSQRKSLINFMAISKGKSMFLKSVDCSGEIKNKYSIASLMKEVINEVGHENIVQG